MGYPIRVTHRSVSDDTAGNHAWPQSTPSDDSEYSEIVDELSRVFYNQESAMVIIGKSKFPRQHLPKFDTSIGFWSRVIQSAKDGKLEGGPASIIEQAHRSNPNNCIFKDYVLRSRPRPPRVTEHYEVTSQRRTHSPRSALVWGAALGAAALIALLQHTAADQRSKTPREVQALRDGEANVLTNAPPAPTKADLHQRQPPRERCATLYENLALLERRHGYLDREGDDWIQSARDCLGPGYEMVDSSYLVSRFETDKIGSFDALLDGLGIAGDGNRTAQISHDGAAACYFEPRDIIRNYYVDILKGLQPQHADIHLTIAAGSLGVSSWISGHYVLLIRDDPPADYIEEFNEGSLRRDWTAVKYGNSRTDPEIAGNMLRLDRTLNGHSAMSGVRRVFDRPLPITSRTTIAFDLLGLRGKSSVELTMELSDGRRVESKLRYGEALEDGQERSEDTSERTAHLPLLALRRGLRYRLHELWPDAVKLHEIRIHAHGDRHEWLFDNIRVYECPTEWQHCTLGVAPREVWWNERTPSPEQRPRTPKDIEQLPLCPPDIRHEDVGKRALNPLSH